MKNEKLIKQYENGALAPAEYLDFEHKLKSDPSFAREVKQYRDLNGLIITREHTDLKEPLTDTETQKKPLAEDSLDTTSYGKRYRHVYAAAAAIIVLIAVFQWFQKEPSAQDLYAAYYQPYKNTLQLVQREARLTELRSQAFLAYEAREFDKALTLFESDLQNTYNPDIAFYKSMSLLSSGRDIEAHSLLTRLKKEAISYKPQLYWYSALIALNANDKQTAREQLDSLTMLNSGYKKNAILKIKEQL